MNIETNLRELIIDSARKKRLQKDWTEANKILDLLKTCFQIKFEIIYDSDKDIYYWAVSNDPEINPEINPESYSTINSACNGLIEKLQEIIYHWVLQELLDNSINDSESVLRLKEKILNDCYQ